MEAESFEEEARDKDLSLAEVVQIVSSKHISKPGLSAGADNLDLSQGCIFFPKIEFFINHYLEALRFS